MVQTFNSLVEMQEYSCRQNNNREIFGTKTREGYRWITYKQFADLVNHLRGGLAHLGVTAGDKVAIISKNSTEWATTAYATYGLRALHVPMYESQTEDDWCYILKDSEAKVLFTATTEIYQKIKNLTKELPHLKSIINIEAEGAGPSLYQELLRKGQEKPVPSQKPQTNETMGLIYTSGTTGFPKGVILSHGNILSNLHALPRLIDFCSDDRSLSFLPWAHIFGQVAEVHVLIYAGFSTGMAEDVTTIVENLAEIRPTILFSVPRIFNKIYDGVHAKMKDQGGLAKYLFDQGMMLATKKKEGKSLSLIESILLGLSDKIVFHKIRQRFGGRLKYAVSGASALNTEVAKFIDNLGIMILEGYGLSETSPLVSVNTLDHRRIGSVGKTIPDVRVVIDSTVLGDDVQNCEEGEIVVYGPNVMQGYHKLPEETKKVMTADGGFRTGDLGRLDKEGFLYITGRIKEQYKLENGKYVVPNIIEDQLKLSPFINNAFLYGANKSYNIILLGVEMVQIEKWAKENGVSAQGSTSLQNPKVHALIEEEINRYCKNCKQYERPQKFVLVNDDWTTENGMLTPTMKLKRSAVYNKYKNTIENLYQ